MRFDRYVLDFGRGYLLADGEEVALRPKTFDFLCYLVANPGRLISKDELLTALWPNVNVSDDSVVQCVTELRRALGDHDQRLIRTVQRRGYRFEVPLTIDAKPAMRQFTTVAADGDKPGGPERPYPFAAVGRRNLVLGATMLALLLAMATFTVWWGPGVDNRISPPPPLSIVVLPFKNLSGDPAQEYFSDGVSNDLSTELSRLPGLFVIAHATARTFKGKDVDARQVGRDLNVRYLLDGSVRRDPDAIRLNVQLISAETGASVWAERFVRGHNQLADWQEEVIGRIANALNFRLTTLESERGLRKVRGNLEAFDLTMRGWAMVYAAKKPENYFSARALFEQALERDPRTANALAGIGWTSAVMVLDGWSVSPAQDVAAARAAAAKALALNPNHFVAHHVRGFVFRLERRTIAARDAFRTAIAINPNFAPGYAQLGATEIELGRPEATIPAVEHAMRLSPRDPSLGPWLAFIGMARLHLGQYEEAASWLSRAIDTGTPVARHHAYLASALALARRLPEARAVLAEFRKTMPTTTIASLRANSRSTVAKFIVQQEPLFDGLRIAGLPE